jgi:hypothetical protein
MKKIFLMIFLIGTPVMAVPVIPNFTQGSMTSHTETTQTVTETINSMDYNTGYQYSATGTGVKASGNLSPGTGAKNDNTRSSVSVHRNLFWARTSESNNYSKSDGGYKHNRYNLHFQSVIGAVILGSLLPLNSYAETVGGVSATASPVANSSGSVTNQAIQVLQGPYITNTYGGGIQCQGPTRNFTPYVTGSASASKPYEPYYDDPVYDISDINEDGLIDNPGDILFTKRTRTGQKDNYSLGVGFSMTWSTPTDKKLQDLCKQAATTQIELNNQIVANKRLDFEIARLKNCGELKLKGIQFHPPEVLTILYVLMLW